MKDSNVLILARRAYPELQPSRLCSAAHADEDEAVRCTVCYPDPNALIDAHNTLKQEAWAAIADVQAEMTHGITANQDFIERRLREGIGGNREVATSEGKRP